MNSFLIVIFRFGFGFSIIVLSYLMLKKPGPEVQGLLNDKVAHFIAFFGLAFFIEVAFPEVKRAWKILVLFSYGLLIEIIQLNLGYRDFSWLDWLADITGVLVYQPLIRPVNAILVKFFPAQENNSG